jgi:lysophospholipase L1-like esterase
MNTRLTHYRPRLALCCALLVAASTRLIATPALDWLYVMPVLALAALAASLVVPGRRWLSSPWVRAGVLLPVLLLALELACRCGSYHRTVYYERQGDLLFAPAPNQDSIEKISLTPSHINNYGLRGRDLTPADLRRRVILCLGDSITFGYGVDDGHTYAAQLQRVLDARYPDQFTVLNGGVNAYPMSFVHQRFLRLWDLGIHPEIVIVGYSMNEGWLGHLVDGDAQVKDQFARRVRLKNFLRSAALYNLVVENWGVAYYEAVKGHLVPGTHVTEWTETGYEAQYDRTLARFVADLRSRQVQPLFVLFSAFHGRTGQYRSDGFLQKQFAGFAAGNGIPFFRTDELFRQVAGGPHIDAYFRDGCHLSERGGVAVAGRLATLVTGTPARQADTAMLPRRLCRS